MHQVCAFAQSVQKYSVYLLDFVTILLIFWDPVPPSNQGFVHLHQVNRIEFTTLEEGKCPLS